MIKIEGSYNSAIVYSDVIEPGVEGFLKAFCNSVTSANSKIRIMPDVHAGKGCAIGTTMTIVDKVVPYFVGVDIGCGVSAIKFKAKKIDFNKLDKICTQNIPHGATIRQKPHRFSKSLEIEDLGCFKHIQYDKALKSIGSLGSGNHFIEIDQDDKGNYWLIVHTGSRHLGLEVAEWYQSQASASCSDDIPYEMSYLEGSMMKDYLHDMRIVQDFASTNRRAIIGDILENMKWDAEDSVVSIHNYIDLHGMVLRKGAISAQEGERIIIPLNMRDGCLICKGKGNPDWNYSAPHGAGRLMSRKEARESLTLSEYKKQMEGIYSTCVKRSTIDESPMAYKSADSIISLVSDTAEIEDILKPVYNFKAG